MRALLTLGCLVVALAIAGPAAADSLVYVKDCSTIQGKCVAI